MDLTGDFFSALRRMKTRGSAPPPVPDPVSFYPPEPAAAPTPDRVNIDPVAPPHEIGPEGIALIKRFESCARQRRDGRYQAYPDPGTGGAPWTIGWGATGPDISAATIWSQAECDARLERDLARCSRAVARALNGAPCSARQFDALVSFHYNTGAIATATLTRLHVAGRYGEAADQFARWVHAGGKRLPGLVRRRAAEAALYRG